MANDDNNAIEPRRFGRYLLLERIGRGGMAEVFRARMFGPGGFTKECAIKKILPSLLDDAQFVSMFIDEARVTAMLTHSNIVQVLELGQLDGHLFIAMEFVWGKDLLDVLARCARRSRRIPRELVLFTMMELLKGLGHAHMARNHAGDSVGIVHRDVSPSNILLSYDGRVKVSDFGIAKSQIQSDKTEIGTQKGKMGYMSPEQVTGGRIDHRSDLFAATVIFFEMLTMSRLFKEKNDLDVMLKIRDVNIESDLNRLRNLPSDLRAIIEKGLSRDASERFQTAAEYHDAIADFVRRADIRVGETQLATFMQQVFADRLTDEKRLRANDPDSAEPYESIVSADDPRFRFRDADGRIHGPMKLAMLDELLRSRPSDPAERVSDGEGDWLGVAEFAELARILRPAPAPDPTATNPPPVAAQMAFRDDAATRDVLEGADWEDLSLGRPEAPSAAARVRRSKGRPRQATPTPINQGSVSGRRARCNPTLSRLTSRFGDPAARGTLDRVSAVRLAHEIAVRRATGVLRIDDGTDERAVYMASGSPVAVDTSVDDELLGAWLACRGMLEPGAVQVALRTAAENDLRLGDALVRLKLIAPHQLYHQLSEHIGIKLRALLFMRDAEWQWWPDATTETEPLPVEVTVDGQVIQAVSDRRRTSWLRAFYKNSTRSPLERRLDNEALEGLQLSARGLRLVTSIQDGMTVADVVHLFADKYRWPESEVYRHFFLVTEFGIFRYEDEAPLTLVG